MTEQEHLPEQGDTYFRAARFHKEREALRAYNRSQELIFRTPCDLSAYRLQVSRIWHVAVVGETPPEELDRRIERILARGEAVELPQQIIDLLQERSREMRSQTEWTEGHYRPGRRLPDL